MDQERADELLFELGGLMVNSEAVTAEEWSSLALVVIRDGSWSVSGLLYTDDDPDDAVPFLPDEEFDDLVPDFHDATLVDGKPGWVSCLFQIKRADMQLRLTFEYDDARRWAITPSNRAAIVAALRG